MLINYYAAAQPTRSSCLPLGLSLSPSLTHAYISEKRPRTEAQQIPEVTVSGVSLCTAGEPNHPGLPHTEQQLCFVRNDLGMYDNDWLKQLSNDDKLWLLKNAFRPDASFKFVSKLEYGKNGSFQHTWIRLFPWLCYSISYNGGFCVDCILFAKTSNLGQLVMINFTCAKATLTEHEKQTSHKLASEGAVAFMHQMEKGEPSVSQMLQNEVLSKIEIERR